MPTEGFEDRIHVFEINGQRVEFVERRSPSLEKIMNHVHKAVFENIIPLEPSTLTHTMHIDPSGKITYNDLPDKEKAPQVYG